MQADQILEKKRLVSTPPYVHQHRIGLAMESSVPCRCEENPLPLLISESALAEGGVFHYSIHFYLLPVSAAACCHEASCILAVIAPIVVDAVRVRLCCCEVHSPRKSSSCRRRAGEALAATADVSSSCNT